MPTALVDTPRGHADDDRSARTLRRPPAELVRHADADAAAAEVRVDGRQRQLRGGAADALDGACASSPKSRPTTMPAARRAARMISLADRGTAYLRRNALPLPLRPEAAAVRHRLPPRRSIRRRPAGRFVLRPARIRSAAGQLHRHRQGRRARAALVPSRPPDYQRARLTGAAVVERDDVRVPDAAAGDAEFSGDAARRVVPHGGAAADRLRRVARHAVGHLRVRVPRRRSRRQLSIQGLRCARPRPEARPRRRARRRAVRHRARGHDRSGAKRQEPAPARRRWVVRRVRLLRGRSTTPIAPADASAAPARR